MFSLLDSPNPDQLQGPTHEQEIDPPIDFSSASDLDSPLNVSNVLGWNDLFGTGLEFASHFYEDQTYPNPFALLASVAAQPEDIRQNDPSRDFTNLDVVESMGSHQGQHIASPPYALTVMTDTELLSHGQVSLKFFKDVIVPTYSPLPMNSKSPWEIMNCHAAVQTLADMTFLQVPDVKHANKANLFWVLACSAFTIVETYTDLSDLPAAKCQQIINHASVRAKSHMQESLMTETRGAQKARYKDQLMAINTLIALAV